MNRLAPLTYDRLQDAYAACMAETARAERKAARKRDGLHAGGLAQCKPPPASVPKPTPAGAKARAIAAERPDMEPWRLANEAGIAVSTARTILRKARGQ